jgi:hypothetical protein
MRRWLAGVLTGCIVVGMAPGVTAADARRASLTRVDAGTVVRIGGKGQWRPAKAGMLVGTGDEIRTARGVAELTYGDGTVTRLGPNSTLGLKDTQTRGLRLWFGRLWMKVAKGSGGMRVQTPAAVAAVTGTDLFVFHETKEGKQSGRQVIATAGSFRLAADAKVSTIGLLEGGVRVQKLEADFNSGMLTRPGKGVWIASLNPQGFRMAQADGFDLNPGQKAVADPEQPTLQITNMDPTEIANNRTVMNDVGGPQPAGSNNSNNSQNGNQGNRGNNGAPPPNQGGTPNNGGPGPNGPGPGPDGRSGPPGPNAPGPNNPQPGGNTPPPNNPPPQGPDPAQPPAPPPLPDPSQTTQDQLIRPVDRSPASGELEIIIR